ncbi:MAG: dual OB domain-containing protein [Dehalococcoidia bacterium]
MRRHLVITDLTRMKGDRVCIFGVDQDGNGVRPDVGPTGIRESHLLDKSGRRVVKPFAVVELDIVRPTPKPPHTEDWEINSHYAPRLVRTLSHEEGRALLVRLLDASVDSIFGADIHGRQYVDEGQGNRSMGTVKASEILAVKQFSTEEGRSDYRMKFSDASGETYDLPITDLVFREYCDSQIREGYAPGITNRELKRRLSQSCVFVRVGLTRPFARMFNRCYLQVCAIHAYPGYVQDQ